MSIGCCPKYENKVNYVNKKLKYKTDLHSNQIVLVCQAWQIKGYHFTFIANVFRIPISDLFTVFRHGFLFQCWLHFMDTFTKFFLHFESLTKKLNFQWNLISLFQLVRVIRFAIQIYNVTLSFQILNCQDQPKPQLSWAEWLYFKLIHPPPPNRESLFPSRS